MTFFTEDQQSAIEYRNLDASVVAGPGAGKTTVLVERYRSLVEDHHFEPNQILAITFTEKAAANMKSKLAEKFSHDQERRRDLESAWVSTIHGFCMRLLRENAIATGLDPRFTVLSPRESDTLQFECLNSALNQFTETRREETLQLIEALYSPYLIGDLKSAYEGIRSADQTVGQAFPPVCAAPAADTRQLAAEFRNLLKTWPAEIRIKPKLRDEQHRLLDWCRLFEEEFETPTHDFAAFMHLMERLDIKLNNVPAAVKPAMKAIRERFEACITAETDRHAAPFRAMLLEVLTLFDETYRNRKNALGRVDFNDLERHTITLLKAYPVVRRKVHEQFRQIMLDEFQDINGQQAELIELLRANNVFFGVGDINQSIYGFRHARPEIFRDYHEGIVAREAHSVELLHNFRSREAILTCVGDVLNGTEGIDKRDLIAGSDFAAKEEPSVEVLEIGDESDDKDAALSREASWIAHRILALEGTLHIGSPGETEAAQFGDFAVLCRNSDSMPPILAAFERAGIPYVCGRRESFLVSRLGLDIIALLKTIANPGDSISLATLLRSPLVGISDEALLRLRLLAGSLIGGLNVFAHNSGDIPEPDATRLRLFHAILHRWREAQPLIPLDLLLARALRDCGVETWNTNVENFLQLARTTGSEMDLQSFLYELEGLATAADLESDLSDEDQGNCVRVMTAHAAKGLEFPVTIIAAMDKGARTESSPVTFTPEHGIGVKWRNPASLDNKEGLKDSWAEANSVVSRSRETEEENRLLYVAMTRAAEHLILSWSRGKNKPSNWAKKLNGHFDLSRFAPSPEPHRETRNGYEVSLLVTDSDPPLLGARVGTERPDVDVHVVSRPVIEDQHESAVTVTSLAVFGQCPRKYYIQRCLGWNHGRFRRFDPDEIDATQEDHDPDLSASRVGSFVHEILAGLTPSEDVPEARRLADVFLNSDLGRRAAAAPRSARAWAFIADIDGVILRGSIDLWFQEKSESDGQIHVVDYKTDAVPDVAGYKPQLALYAMALERALGIRPTSAYLHFLRPDRVVEIPIDDAALREARALIASLRTAQDELRFDLNEGKHCRSCQFYRGVCPAGRQNIIERTPETT
jgi:ATP-dependent helicase/nuclease subunit A